jgi:carbon storage regulator CsrA
MPLTLSRKVGEQTFIGEGADRVVVTIVAVRGAQVQIGIEAAPHIPIVRSELRAKR